MKKILIVSYIVIAGLMGFFTACSSDDENNGSGEFNTISVTVNPFDNGGTPDSNPELACSFSLVGRNLQIDWGDGSDPVAVVSSDNNISFVEHTFPMASAYKVIITGVDIRTLIVGRAMQTTEAGQFTDANASIVDLSGAPSVLKLICDNNPLLTKLELGTSEHLQQLSCNNCKLSELNLSHSIQLLALNCTKNNLSTLNLSKNAVLTHVFCNNNHLTTLDLSKNTNIKCVNASYNNMNAKSLNGMMGTLPTLLLTASSGSLYLSNNPGTATCTTTIATQKNWTVYAQ